MPGAAEARAIARANAWIDETIAGEYFGDRFGVACVRPGYSAMESPLADQLALRHEPRWARAGQFNGKDGYRKR
jgi:hypothetical protein